MVDKESSRVFIIAEAGVNHNGNIKLAKAMIDVAVDACCDAVKFQTFDADSLVSKNAVKADYQIENTGNEQSQYNMLKSLQLTYENHVELINYCKEKGIMFLSTPFDKKSADLLEQLGLQIFKIPSGEITNIPFLRHIARKKKKIILSTGMSYIGEVETAVKAIKEEGNKDLILLQCITNYPANYEEVNLKAMITMKNAFKLDTGYSDHTMGIEVPIAAVAMGAKVIEKHFTLDRGMEGPDHKASLVPEELKQMVRSIRNIEKAFGNGIKAPAKSEKNTREVARKSIVANKNLRKGTTIQLNMLVMKRPGTGIQPDNIDLLIGHTLKEDIEVDQVIEWRHIL